MSIEIFISQTWIESRMAVVHSGELTDIFIEHQHSPTLVDNIYLGVVVRVLTGMQAAFVDIGRPRMAFLHLDDVDKGQSASQTTQDPSIEQYIQTGTRILVQVLKDELGDKGARLTTKLSVATGRLVYFPNATNIGVSQKIAADRRHHLQAVLQTYTKHHQGGFVARTLASDATDEQIQADVDDLTNLWHSILGKKSHSKHPQQLYQAPSLLLRHLQVYLYQDVKAIWVDDLPLYHRIAAFIHQHRLSAVPQLHYHQEETALFCKYQIQAQLQTALSHHVPLKSGGYLVIDQTEAMTVIDVNTGSFVGKHSFSHTVYHTNLEAAHMAARQIRLRNLGGIIIIDFIDMTNDKHRNQVLSYFKKQLALDPVKTTIVQVSKLGLIELTRQRTHQSLTQQLCQTCPTCQGQGMIWSVQTTALQMYRELISLMARHKDAQTWQVFASNELIDFVVSSQMVADLHALTDKYVQFLFKLLPHPSKYQIVFA